MGNEHLDTIHCPRIREAAWASIQFVIIEPKFMRLVLRPKLRLPYNQI